MADAEVIRFGFPDFASTLFAAKGPALQLADAHSRLANEMLSALPGQMNVEQAVIYVLVRMTTTGWVELLILMGNGAGLGAMKIARGMFETAVMAEYLRQVPAEIDDYLEYGRILQFKRVKVSPGVVSPERFAEFEVEFNRAKTRFQDQNGRTRNQWNKHPISYMAEKVGRKEQYELPYSLAASIHHGNFEALTAHLSGDGSALEVESPPSLEWVNQALISGHTYLLQALDTLNDLLNLGFDDRLRLASKEFGKVWSNP
jgi:hypothetical protein